MTNWVRSGVLDNGLNDIKNNATKMLLLSTYTFGDSYATVYANRLNAGATMAPADFTLANSGSNRSLTVASGKSDTCTAASGVTDKHIAFTDGADAVIWITNKTTDQRTNIKNIINFPAPVYVSNQPS